MYGLLLVLHLIVCVMLVFVVLVQSGKGGGLAGGAFGGATQTVFGGRGATDFITRATIVLGVVFFITSLSLALITTRSGTSSRSLLQEQARKAQQTAPPAAPTPAAAPTGAPTGAPSGGATPPAEQPSAPSGR
jgi:preprotein translocase subunit SecG